MAGRILEIVMCNDILTFYSSIRCLPSPLCWYYAAHAEGDVPEHIDFLRILVNFSPRLHPLDARDMYVRLNPTREIDKLY